MLEWGGRWRGSGFPGGVSECFNVAFEGDHFDGCLGCFGTFVAEAAPGTVEGLLLVFHGQNTEDHGEGAVGVERCDTLRDALAYVVEMGRVAAYYASEHYHGVVEFSLDKLRGGEGELHGSGNIEGVHVVLYVEYVVFENSDGSFAESRGDMSVPFGADDCHSQIVYFGEVAAWSGSGYCCRHGIADFWRFSYTG